MADTIRIDLADNGRNAVPKTAEERIFGTIIDGTRLFINWEAIPEETIPLEKNLVLKAVSLFRERTGFAGSINIHLNKRIPVGSGLGGASSDAASTLLALNSLAGADLAMDELGGMALILGSDSPFFLSGGAAFVSGRGELIEPVNSPGELWAILVMPPFHIDTGSAYRLLDEAREAAPEIAIQSKNMSAILYTGYS